MILQVAVPRPRACAATATLHSSSAKEHHSTGCRRGPIVSAGVAPRAAAQPPAASSFIDGPPEQQREGWTPCVLTPTVHGDELTGTVRIAVRPPAACSMTTTAIGLLDLDLRRAERSQDPIARRRGSNSLQQGQPGLLRRHKKKANLLLTLRPFAVVCAAESLVLVRKLMVSCTSVGHSPGQPSACQLHGRCRFKKRELFAGKRGQLLRRCVAA